MNVILFDLDGTLLDTLDDLADAVNYALNQFHFPERTRAEIRSFVGNGVRNLVFRSLPEDKKEQTDEVLGVFLSYYSLHSRDKTCPYPGIGALLDRLAAKGYAMGIVSNKIDQAVKLLQTQFFPQTVYAAGEIEGLGRKPDPECIFRAIEQMGGTRERTIYVGDSEVDLKTGQNAGIPVIAVTWGFRDEAHLREVGGTRFAHSNEELERQLDEFFSSSGQ